MRKQCNDDTQADSGAFNLHSHMIAYCQETSLPALSPSTVEGFKQMAQPDYLDIVESV